MDNVKLTSCACVGRMMETLIYIHSMSHYISHQLHQSVETASDTVTTDVGRVVGLCGSVHFVVKYYEKMVLVSFQSYQMVIYRE